VATKNYVDITVGAVTPAGDINLTSFAGANNQVAAANITGLAFNSTNIRSFQGIVSVRVNATSSLYEQFQINGINKNGSWEMAVSSVGDASSVVLSITSAGQVQYTSGNYAGFVSLDIRFRAIITTT
jgi:hypothetical protein